jgi:hypothetical protein
LTRWVFEYCLPHNGKLVNVQYITCHVLLRHARDILHLSYICITLHYMLHSSGSGKPHSGANERAPMYALIEAGGCWCEQVLGGTWI